MTLRIFLLFCCASFSLVLASSFDNGPCLKKARLDGISEDSASTVDAYKSETSRFELELEPGNYSYDLDGATVKESTESATSRLKEVLTRLIVENRLFSLCYLTEITTFFSPDEAGAVFVDRAWDSLEEPLSKEYPMHPIFRLAKEALALGISNGRQDVLHSAIAAGLNFNQPIYDSRTRHAYSYLHLAVWSSKSFPIIKNVFSRTSSPDVLDSLGLSPLHYSCRMGSTSLANFLVNQGANPNLVSPVSGDAPVHEALKSKSYIIVKHFLQLKHFDVNVRDANGKHLVFYFFELASEIIFSKLLFHEKLAIKAQDFVQLLSVFSTARTPNHKKHVWKRLQALNNDKDLSSLREVFMELAQNSDMANIQGFMSYFPTFDLNFEYITESENSPILHTPLIIAVLKNDFPLMNYFLSKNAKVHYRTSFNMSAFSLANSLKSVESIHILLKSTTPQDNFEALQYAIISDSARLVSYFSFEENEALFRQRSSSHLLYAASLGSLKVLRYLIGTYVHYHKQIQYCISVLNLYLTNPRDQARASKVTASLHFLSDISKQLNK